MLKNLNVLQMPGLEIYELWLRTGWADPGDWLEFLCEGEGVFGDCTTSLSMSQHWPGEGEAEHTEYQHSLTLNNQ